MYIYISIIYFGATYTYIVNTDLKLINWDKINSYYCYYNHIQSNVVGYIALLFMYLYLLIKLLLITHIYYILYLLTKEKSDEYVNIYNGENKVIEMIKKRRDNGKLIILSCHDSSLIEELADKIYYMKAGELI